MKNINKKLTLSLMMISILAMNLMAQPSAPSTPDGNPIPVGGLGILALIAGGIVAFYRKNRK